MDRLNPCISLRKSLKQAQEICDLSNVLQQELGQKGFSNIEKGIKKREELYVKYKQEVRSLLGKFFGIPIKEGEFEFENSGRVVLNGDYISTDTDSSYFPSIFRKVNGKLHLAGSSIQELDYLEEVDTLVLSENPQLDSIARLKKVSGLLLLDQTPVSIMPELEVAGRISVKETEIEGFPSLRWVKGNFFAETARNLVDLSSLARVDGHLDLSFTSVSKLPKLTNVNSNLILTGVEDKRDLPELEYVGGSCFLSNLSMISAPSLRVIGSCLQLFGTEIESFRSIFKSLKTIGRNSLGYSVYTEQKEIKKEIELLQEQGMIELEGVVFTPK